MTQEELKLVLDSLKWCHGGEPCGTAEAIAVVEKALANVATNDTSKERVDEMQKQRHEQEPSIQDRLNNALQSLDFYRRRIYALQEWHGKMRDPERTIVCDIIANGHTLDPAGDRYTHSPQPKQEPVAGLSTDRNPLTVEELKIIWQNLDPCDIVCRGVIRALVRAVESAHGIKENT